MLLPLSRTDDRDTLHRSFNDGVVAAAHSSIRLSRIIKVF
jgi:hypothetical protein